MALLWPEAHHLYEPPQEKACGDVVEHDAEADAAFLAEVEALRADHQRVRIMLADLKFELALRALGRKYSADQPRVPARNSDGGQWTSGGAGETAPKDAPGNPQSANSDSDAQKILAMGKQLRLAAGPQDYQKRP